MTITISSVQYIAHHFSLEFLRYIYMGIMLKYWNVLPPKKHPFIIPVVCGYVNTYFPSLGYWYIPSFMGSIVGYRKRAKQFFCIFGQWVGQPYLFNLGVCMVHSAMKFGGGGKHDK